MPRKRILPDPFPAELGSVTLADIFSFYEQRGYGHTVGRGHHPALVVVDFSVSFTRGMPNFPSAGYDAEVAATVSLQTAARRAGLPIYYTTIAYESHMRDAGLWGVKIPWIEALQYGSVAMDIDERLARRPEEPVIVKKYPSAFFETDLQEDLEGARVDTVILAGCTTSSCVRATAIDSMQRGFKTVIGAEAVGDLTPVLHWLHLTDLASRYVDVARVSELTEYMESCRQNAA